MVRKGLMTKIGEIPYAKELVLGASLYLGSNAVADIMEPTSVYASERREIEKFDTVLDVETLKVKVVNGINPWTKTVSYGKGFTELEDFVYNLGREDKELYNVIVPMLGSIDENGKFKASEEKIKSLDKGKDGLVTIMGRSTKLTKGTEIGGKLMDMGFSGSKLSKARSTISNSNGGSDNSGTGSGNGGGTGGDPCFLAGTKIIMADNSLKNIEDIKVLDEVLSYNEETNENEVQKVLGIKSRVSDHYYNVEFIDGTILKVTDNHPLLSKDGWSAININAAQNEKGMVCVQLSENDEILSSNGSFKKIISMERIDGDVVVYDLSSIDVTRTFYVEDVLAHNYGGGCSGL